MQSNNSTPKFNIYVDIDDTLVRSYGSKRMPITATIKHIKELKKQGAKLYCWRSVGSEYAENSARELGILDIFEAFLPKPQMLLDDQEIMQGKLTEIHRYENPGHHDPNTGSLGRENVKFNPKKSVSPDNHVDLFKTSIAFKKPNGEIYRYAQDEFGNIYRFEPSVDGYLHWSGSTNGKTLSGELRGLNIPPEVQKVFQ